MKPPSRPESAPIGLVLLAAGAAKRMGQAKQLLDFGGRPLVRWAAETALESVCRPVVVVVGAAADGVKRALEKTPVVIAYNNRWSEGMGTSIAAGVKLLANQGVSGTVLALADQPFVTTAILNQLVEVHLRMRNPIVASEYAGTLGVPALFGRALFPELMSLGPAQGCKPIIMKHEALAAAVPCPEAAADIDTPADYQRICLG